MNTKFDELTKNLARAVTRRGALKEFGVGLAGLALAALGLTQRAEAAARPFCIPTGSRCQHHVPCCSGICSNGACVCGPSLSGCFTSADCCSGVCLRTFTRGFYCK